jgi:hypothetical protein
VGFCDIRLYGFVWWVLVFVLLVFFVCLLLLGFVVFVVFLGLCFLLCFLFWVLFGLLFGCCLVVVGGLQHVVCWFLFGFLGVGVWLGGWLGGCGCG